MSWMRAKMTRMAREREHLLEVHAKLRKDVAIYQMVAAAGWVAYVTTVVLRW